MDEFASYFTEVSTVISSSRAVAGQPEASSVVPGCAGLLAHRSLGALNGGTYSERAARRPGVPALAHARGWLASVFLAFGVAGTAGFAADAPPAPTVIPVARPPAATRVEFQRDILPILRANCLPCHNKTAAKADLLMESPADMLKGGESGPALVIGKPAESLLFRLSTHEAKPRMPPKENKANARALTPEELGLLSVWIEQGAKGSGNVIDAIPWQTLSGNIQNIAAAAVTADGRFAACGRGSQLALYDLGRGERVDTPVDPALGTAHRDTVNALALSADGEWLASGGFREVKLWRRVPPSGLPEAPAAATGPVVLTNTELKRLVSYGGNEPARLTDFSGTNVLARLELDRVVDFTVAEARRHTNVAASLVGSFRTAAETARKGLPSAAERRTKATAALESAVTNVLSKQAAHRLAAAARDMADFEVLRAERTGDTNRIKSAQEKQTAAVKALEGPERERKQATDKQSSAEEELRLAIVGLTRATLALSGAERALAEAEAGLQQAAAQLTVAEQAARHSATNSRVQVAWFAHGQLITRHSDGSHRTWNPHTGAALDRFLNLAPGQAAPLTQPTWRLAHVIGNETNSPFADRVNALAFRPDGRRLAVGSGDPSRGGDLHILEPSSGEMRYAITNLHSDSILTVAWSPDGRWLATGGADRLARLVDTASGHFERVFEGHTGHVLTVAWSPDGRLLATGGAEGSLKFWDAFTGDKRKGANGSGKEMTGAAFLDGEQVVSASGDPAVTVWKVGGEKIREAEKLTDYQQTLAASPDGQTIVAGGMDGILRVWRGKEAKPVWSFAPPDNRVAKAGTAGR